jgi:hypothetical protein
MKFFRLDLLTLLISLFILNSCKNEDTIGLTNGTTGTVSGSLIDTATVFINTTSEDTVVTSGITNVPLGYFKDPLLGSTTSNMITDINLPLGGVSTNTSYALPTGTIYIDSAVLRLKYATTGFYGDSLTSRYKVKVYQLGQRFYSTTSYYNDSQWTYGSALLGTTTFYARAHDTLKVDTPVSGGPDTLIKVVPEVRIRIDTNFIRANMMSNTYQQLNSNLLFQNYVRGFFITMDQNQQGAGGILMFQAPADSALEVHIRSINGITVDTTVVYYNISQHAAQISHVYPSTVTAAKSNTTTHSDSLVYLQGLASLRAKISLPYIKTLFKSLGNNVVINRAEIVLTAAPGSDIPSYLTPQPYLSLYRYDIAHQRVSVEDASSSDPRAYSGTVFGGIYNLTTQQYHFLVTSYVQDLIDGATIDYGTYIGVISGTDVGTSVDIAATPEAAGRSVVVGSPKSTSSLYPYRVKLNVIYTVTKKQ